MAIIGPGSIGLFHLQAFKSAGASLIIVIGLDQDATRLEIAQRLGADHVINASREDVVGRVKDFTGGLGCDIVVEAANHPSTVGQAIDLASAYGRVMLFGLYPEATISPLTLMRSGVTRCTASSGPPRRGLRQLDRRQGDAGVRAGGRRRAADDARVSRRRDARVRLWAEVEDRELPGCADGQREEARLDLTGSPSSSPGSRRPSGEPARCPSRATRPRRRWPHPPQGVLGFPSP